MHTMEPDDFDRVSKALAQAMFDRHNENLEAIRQGKVTTRIVDQWIPIGGAFMTVMAVFGSLFLTYQQVGENTESIRSIRVEIRSEFKEINNEVIALQRHTGFGVPQKYSNP